MALKFLSPFYTQYRTLLARVAAQLVKTFASFPFMVHVSCHGKTANGKSILQVLSLGAQYHDIVTIDYETDDGTQVMDCEQSLSEILEATSKS